MCVWVGGVVEQKSQAKTNSRNFPSFLTGGKESINDDITRRREREREKNKKKDLEGNQLSAL